LQHYGATFHSTETSRSCHNETLIVYQYDIHNIVCS